MENDADVLVGKYMHELTQQVVTGLLQRQPAAQLYQDSCCEAVRKFLQAYAGA